MMMITAFVVAVLLTIVWIVSEFVPERRWVRVIAGAIAPAFMLFVIALAVIQAGAADTERGFIRRSAELLVEAIELGHAEDCVEALKSYESGLANGNSYWAAKELWGTLGNVVENAE